jgi:hypothetical protein
MFTVDWFDNPYSDEPSDYKAGHILAADDGYLICMPNNRIYWRDSNWVTNNFPTEAKNIKVDKHLPSVESVADKWITEDTDSYFYDINEKLRDVSLIPLIFRMSKSDTKNKVGTKLRIYDTIWQTLFMSPMFFDAKNGKLHRLHVNPSVPYHKQRIVTNINSDYTIILFVQLMVFFISCNTCCGLIEDLKTRYLKCQFLHNMKLII